MQSVDGRVQLLVKAHTQGPAGQFAFGPGAKIDFTLAPLFRSIGRPAGPAAASGPGWSLLTIDASAETINPWDACHALASGGGGTNIGAVDFVEPDLLQRWPIEKSATAPAFAAARTGGPHSQDGKDYPAIVNDNLWFRDSQHGQFAAALADVPDPADGRRVRIAHLDTGFDPDHRTRPQHISVAEQRNFVDADFPNDARDRASGPFNNFSHGTGTLSILAGAPVAPGQGFGCAPFAEIIPIRVADHVVLFRNSAIAKAFDYVHSLCRSPATAVHVITMSMGGLPSRAWADAVNALYDAGVFVVTAAGNNYGNLPSHYIVYPARFNRVVAATGVMADGKPYADLKPTLMAGDYGPDDKMATAIAAYTPNVPWARIGEPAVIDFDGTGTSAATPQIAGAAALWIQKNRDTYDGYEGWMRVEAVRHALFASATVDPERKNYFGAGKLRARDALHAAEPDRALLRPQPPDDVSFSSLHVLFGMSLGRASPKSAMIELELRHVLQSTGLEQKLAVAATPKEKARIVDEILSLRSISQPLREALGDRAVPASAPEPHADTDNPMEKLHLALALDPKIPPPSSRKLRVFAYDPSLQTDIGNYAMNEAIVDVRWEADLRPGPIGEYVEVIDVDPGSRCCYAPVDLNHPHLLAEAGLAPSEANPQFHQQMVYAIAMRTIARFERALGRRALWTPHVVRGPDGNVIQSEYVGRLRIYPHALREENAYYSRERLALLFGYFKARAEETGTTLPGSRVFCAVSHDIIAHETTHALLDGLHPRYQESTNVDMLAFHEAFADIVALFQHFTMPEALLHQIKRNRADLTQDNLLGGIAQQFGQASGLHGALRSFIGEKPDPKDYELRAKEGEPHNLGAVLVSAVFAAFNTIYRARIADIIRLATNGTGILPNGEISHDLAGRLAREAAKVADQVLNMCIRALDYCPPVDLRFGDYIRAIITADYDLVPDDSRGYRVAFISAFRDRGIFPINVRHLAEDSLVWETPPLLSPELERIGDLVQSLDLRWSLNTARQSAYEASRKNAVAVRDWLVKQPAILTAMGFEPAQQSVELAGMRGEMRPIEVHSVRPCRRTAPDGSSLATLVIEITQTFRAEPDQSRYRGGCTLIVDLNSNAAKYIIRKRLRGFMGASEQMRYRNLAAEQASQAGVRYLDPGTASDGEEAFALLHRCAPRGN